jgi:predicted dehydrogenase
MVGLDTSHAAVFTRLLHDPQAPESLRGARVVAAYPGGSQAFALSFSRVEGFTRQLRDEFGVQIVDSIEAVAQVTDAILLESCDGRQHLEQFRRLAAFGKPVFIDKPLATSTAEAREIFALAAHHGAPVFSSSALRFAAGIAALPAGEGVLGAIAYGPSALLPDFPGYFWYGVHAAEILFARLGRGCHRVCVERADGADVLTGHWADGRVGVVYAHRLRGVEDFGCTVFTAAGTLQADSRGGPPGYARLLAAVLAFFRSGRPPVDPGETLEIIAFLEAANRSREGGGAVPLA